MHVLLEVFFYNVRKYSSLNRRHDFFQTSFCPLEVVEVTDGRGRRANYRISDKGNKGLFPPSLLPFLPSFPPSSSRFSHPLEPSSQVQVYHRLTLSSKFRFCLQWCLTYLLSVISGWFGWNLDRSLKVHQIAVISNQYTDYLEKACPTKF